MIIWHSIKLKTIYVRMVMVPLRNLNHLRLNFNKSKLIFLQPYMEIKAHIISKPFVWIIWTVCVCVIFPTATNFIFLNS